MVGWEDKLENKKDDAKGAAKEHDGRRQMTSRWSAKARPNEA